MKDPYEILGVSRDADEKEIQQAFRTLARKYHPDMGGDQEKFVEINEAYERIKNGDTSPLGNDPFDPRNMFWDANFDFDDLFSTRRRWVNRNSNVTIALHITLDDILQNAKKTLKLKLPSGGTRTVTIEIPNGATTGKKVIYHGYGENTKEGHPGDLYVTFVVNPHADFTIDVYDIHVTTKISLLQAMTGTEIVVPCPGESNLKLLVKAGTQHHTKLRIPEKGLRDSNGRRGNLIVNIEVKIPSLTPNQLDNPIRSLDTSIDV